MTQPRRISAIGVADRIANEMNTGRGRVRRSALDAQKILKVKLNSVGEELKASFSLFVRMT